MRPGSYLEEQQGREGPWCVSAEATCQPLPPHPSPGTATPALGIAGRPHLLCRPWEGPQQKSIGFFPLLAGHCMKHGASGGADSVYLDGSRTV
jgi:hypothetical protein